ncbi:hypothetical protein [Quadrisphaera setariae]|uniref:Uncharacterized protein n=1 Tax=Quadrisphaera setariae TaxID=2593304 RepID=A0A5C8ZEJ5_9ACTN|nr:hypothetical protein [Quadrisphaera setariae]TXR56475.1 hypothetical protein FMM08_10330 [Quadrisphaera setariae]
MSEQTAPLIRRADLAVWARTEVEPDDRWATTCMAVASALVREEARQPDWTVDTAPVMARIITAQCAVRAYLNPPEGEVSTSIGPLGSRLLDAVAEGIYLTEAERERLAGYAPAQDRARGSRTWVASMASESSPPVTSALYRLPEGAGPTEPAEVVWVAES